MPTTKKGSNKQIKKKPHKPALALSSRLASFYPRTLIHNLHTAFVFAQSGGLTLANLAFAFTSTCLMVWFPIVRAAQTDAILDEQERQSQYGSRVNPDAYLPTQPGAPYNGLGGAPLAVPISPSN